MENLWHNWQGKKIQDKNGEIFIATLDCDWSMRFSIWKKAYRNNIKTSCPMPLPINHLNFDSHYYSEVTS